jgi:hypothetical protein
MKMNHIYFHILTLFFVLSSNVLFTTLDSANLFDIYQKNFNQKKDIELKQKEFLKRYQQLKKQLLETFKIHQDNPQLEQELKKEEVCNQLQPSMQNEQEKKDAQEHFLDSNQSKRFVLITLKSNDNKSIQSKFVLETALMGAGKAAIAWIGSLLGGGALTATEIAAIEAAKIAAAKIAAGAAGAYVAGSAIQGGIDKFSDKNKNSGSGGGSNSGGNENNGKENKNNSSQERINKLHRIESLEKTNPAQAKKETEELRASLTHADEQERKKKLIETHFPKDMPNREQALIEAGLIKDTIPGYTLVNNNPCSTVKIPTKPSKSQTATATEAKLPNVITQQSTTPQAPTTAKSSNEAQVATIKTTAPTQQASTPTQEKTVIKSTPLSASTDSFFSHPHIAMHQFMPWQITTTPQEPTKIEPTTDQVTNDTDDDIISKAFASLIFPPGNDPDNDPDNDEENIEKKEKIPSKNNSEVKKQSGPTPPRSLANKKASALRKAERLAKNKVKLPDGRIRYYEAERPSDTPGPTRGRSYVTEFDPKTGNVRQWHECYDHHGNINRVRPTMINGRKVVSQHYPATYKDIQENIKGSKWHIPEKNLD